MSEFKVQGETDLKQLMLKSDTWNPPISMKEFTALVEKVITSSKYTDSYMDGNPQTLENLRALVQVKANRVKLHPDIEECVDVAAYAYMVYHILTNS